MITKPDRPPFPRGGFGFAGFAIAAVLFLAGGFSNWLTHHSSGIFIIFGLSVASALILWCNHGGTRCRQCDAELGWREQYTTATPCWFCRIYTQPDVLLPAAEDTDDVREQARRNYRQLARTAICDPRSISADLLRGVGEQREVGIPGDDERWRLFYTYASQLLSEQDFRPDDLVLLKKMRTKLTGCDEDLSILSVPQALGVRLELRAINAGWLPEPADQPLSVRLEGGERLLWSEPVQWMDPTKQKLTSQQGVDASFQFMPGARVSTKTTLEHSIELPPGPLHEAGDVILAVTTAEIKIVGNHAGRRIIGYDQIVGVFSEELSHICTINCRDPDEAINLKCRSGALMVAVIRFAYRLREGDVSTAGASP